MITPSEANHSNFTRKYGAFDGEWGYTHQASFSPDGRAVMVAMNLWVGHGELRQTRQPYGVGPSPAAAVDDCLNQIWFLRPVKDKPPREQTTPEMVKSDPVPAAPVEDTAPLAPIDTPAPAQASEATQPAEEAPKAPDPVVDEGPAQPAPEAVAARPTVDVAIVEINRLTDGDRLRKARTKAHALFPDLKQKQQVLDAIDARLKQLEELSATPA